MKQISNLSIGQTKEFSVNHRKQKVILKSYSKDTSSTFEARLTLGEFQAICDFVTKNFTDNKKI